MFLPFSSDFEFVVFVVAVSSKMTRVIKKFDRYELERTYK